MNLSLKSSKFQKVSNIKIPDIFYRRMKTGVKEFDTMFGEGILPGSAFTVTAAPGTGKTTFLLQLCEALSNNGYDVGYASGEENKYQLAYTCKRLNVKSVQIANETDIDALAEATQYYDVLVIDSFQALSTIEHRNKNQLEQYAVNTLVQAAKKNECALFFILHLTKSGQFKGSTLIPHTVDTNIQILMDEEGEDCDRLIDFYKNRFGPCGQFNATMTHSGFQISGRREVVKSPSKKSRRADKSKLLDAICAIKEPPGITKDRIMKEFNLTGSQTYLALKELTDSGRMIKYGRGEDARWKLTKV